MARTLPAPSANFTLPSLFDDLELHCRLYFPRVTIDNARLSVHGCAILAHPYAPLGGSYDDPIVQSVGSLLIKEGFLLVTFNFRGADKSPGKTSWSGKAELGDYTSAYALLLALMNVEGVSSYISRGATDEPAMQPLLLLGGYSYGSMIAAHLPDIKTVLNILQHSKVGTAEHEIETRAHELAKAFLGYCQSQQHRGRSHRKLSESLSPAAATFGGYESPTAAQRISREGSRRSIDGGRVRQSVDRVRRKIGSRGNSDIIQTATSSTEVHRLQIMPRVAYLMVSPVLGPVATFATMFSKLRFERRARSATAAKDAPVIDPNDMLSSNSSLVLFGTDDHFTSSRKVRAWCEALKARPGSQLSFCEILDAGHFWHDADLESQMLTAVSNWLTTLS